MQNTCRPPGTAPARRNPAPAKPPRRRGSPARGRFSPDGCWSHRGMGTMMRRDAQRRQLADGGGSRPADHQIRRPHHRGHVVDVFPDLQRRVVRQVTLPFSAQCLSARSAYPLLPAPWIWWNGSFAASRASIVRHLGVHAGSAQRPPEGDDQRPSIIDAQLLPWPASLVRVKKSSRTGVPVTATFSGCL